MVEEYLNYRAKCLHNHYCISNLEIQVLFSKNKVVKIQKAGVHVVPPRVIDLDQSADLKVNKQLTTSNNYSYLYLHIFEKYPLNPPFSPLGKVSQVASCGLSNSCSWSRSLDLIINTSLP